MPVNPLTTNIYHITDISNLAGIIANGGLSSDASMQAASHAPSPIGYQNIKHRRLHEYTVPCCGGSFVGEFVPFYFCPRSPMLYTINKGNTGKQPGCQKDIVHLVSSVQHGYNLGVPWAISDGNAGASYTTFSNTPNALDGVDWNIVNSNDWSGPKITKKHTEFLIKDFFPLGSILEIGCHNLQAATNTKAILATSNILIPVNIYPNWYY